MTNIVGTKFAGATRVVLLFLARFSAFTLASYCHAQVQNPPVAGRDPNVPISSKDWKPDLAPADVSLTLGLLSPEVVERMKAGSCRNIFWQKGSGSEEKPFAITWNGPPWGEGPSVSGLLALDRYVVEIGAGFRSTIYYENPDPNSLARNVRVPVPGEEMAISLYGSADTPPKAWVFYAKRLTEPYACDETNKYCRMYEAQGQIIEVGPLGTRHFKKADVGHVFIKVNCAIDQRYIKASYHNPFWRPSRAESLLGPILRRD